MNKHNWTSLAALAAVCWSPLALPWTVTASGDLSSQPAAMGSAVPPNVMFALSVEFPTAISAAYPVANDYSSANTYKGYFDPTGCYTYNSGAGYFEPSSKSTSTDAATAHSCTGKWSGNFLNWATMTGLDEFRKAMTGGNRYIDSATQTVVERSFQSNQGSAGSNFNQKSVTAAVAATVSPYSNILKIDNWNKGVNVVVTEVNSHGDVIATHTFAVRALVCDPSWTQAWRDSEGNCVAYGTVDADTGLYPSYKPEGAIQKNGQNMRFGVFSYFNSDIIDNAVMRSKAKYVAPKKWQFGTAGGVTNGAAEWSGANGTLVANPDPTVASASFPAAVTKSGVINYINQFGTVSAGYKTYDDVGKLYYETLKYLRGGSPTTAFYNKATAASADGFPIITTWDDPAQDTSDGTKYTCRRNYIIAMGDTHTWCDKWLPGGTFTTTGHSVCNYGSGGQSTNNPAGDKGSLADDSGHSTVDVSTWTNKISAGLATSLTGAGGASYYMSGLAYWAATQDIRDDIGGDPQHVKTYVIDVEESRDCGYQSQYWYAAKYGGADSYDASGNPIDWSTTLSLTSGCDSRRPPGYPGNVTWPKTLLRANDPDNMTDSVNKALGMISAEAGQVSALSQSSGSLISGGAYLYNSSFKGLEGDVTAYQVSTTGTLTKSWSAAVNMPAETSRIIYTFNDGLKADGTTETGTYSRTGVTFTKTGFTTSPSNFSSREQAFLNGSDSLGADRVAYLRGDQSNETPDGYKWRARTSLLGDIVNSSPIYVARPKSSNLPGIGYAAFVTSVKNRTPMVYAGSNDGMLHGFDASATASASHTPGKELMAYVPSSVYYRLSDLTSAEYTHEYLVDGTPAAADVCTGACDQTDGSDWKTLLIGGLRAGGKGIFALDVTNPANFTTANASSVVKWEFTNMDDRDLGFTYGTPLIRLMANGKWAAIFGSGYNNTTSTGASGDKVSSTGRAYIYIVFVDGPSGSGGAWTSGTDYVKIALPSPGEPAALPLNPANGLSSITSVDKNGDGKVDYLYAGDLHGNLWKINVSNANPSYWDSAFKTGGGTLLPLFSATDGTAAATPQPITSGIVVTRHPDGGFLVIFGTGAYAFKSDMSSADQQTLYAIWDKDSSTQTVPVSRGTLQKQEIIATSGSYFLESNCTPNYTTTPTTTGDGLATGCPAAVTNSAQQFGWYFDLPHSKERVVMDRPLLDAGILTVMSLAPNSVDACSPSASSGWRYDLDYLTGGRPSSPVYTSGTTGSTSALTVTFVVGGVTITWTYPSGMSLGTGGSDTPARFAGLPTSVPTPDTAGSSSPTTATSLGATFIPGWGVPSYMGKGACTPKSDFPNNASTPTTICPYGTRGRISWRRLSQ